VNWDDYRIFLAIARAGSLSGASRTLGVNHSTVFRRLEAFEERLGVRLFERQRDGYALTPEGDEMRGTAERLEADILELDRKLEGRDLKLEGTLVVTTTDTLMSALLSPHLAGFAKTYPGIKLDLVLDSQYVNLSKRQADVAIRPTIEPPETLVGRRFGDIAIPVYGPRHMVDAALKKLDLKSLPWIGFDESLGHLAAAKWMRQTLSTVEPVHRANNFFAIEACILGGLGVGFLPGFMGDRHAKLKRILAPKPETGSALWILTHEDLRKTARVRAFMDFMKDSLEADRDLIEGQRPFGASPKDLADVE